MITGLLMGALPAWRASRGDVSAALRTGVREGGGRRSRLRTTLTVTQAALSVVLLVGAGLFVKSLWTVRTLDLGVDADRILVVETTRASLASIPAGPSREAERQRRRVFFFDALERVRAVPGVEQASVAIGTPFGNRFTVKLRVADRADVPRLPGGGPGISAVTEGYFETAGTPIRRGRAFTPEDGPGTEPVAIVSELMAKTLWPGGDPIGRCLLIGDGTPACARIVGVAGNTYRSRLREDPVMHYYIPAGQEVGFGGAALLVRTADTTGAVSGEIRRLLTGLDGSITYVTAETMQSRIDPQMRPWRLGATVFALSGLLALVVAGIGIYSVMSYLVADRRGEISVRLALGAQSRDIMRLVLRGSLLMAVAGVVIGELMAASLGRFVEPLLFNTSPRDPVVLAGIGGLLVAVALVGTLMPALRARRINAIDALKGP
jgi:predicted permease